MTPQVKAHLSVLLGLLALVKAAGYWLQRYELTLSTRGVVDGASYTDVKAQLPGHQPAAAHLARRRRRCSSSTSGAGAGCCRCSAVGLWALRRRGGRRASTRRSSSGSRSSRPSRRRSGRTSSATSRRRATALGLDEVEHRARSTLDDGRRPPSTSPANDADGPQHPAAGTRDVVLGDTFQQLQGDPRLLPDQRRRRRPLRARRRAPTQVVLSASASSTPADIPQRLVGGPSTSPTPTATALVLAPANAVTADGAPDFVVSDVPADSGDRLPTSTSPPSTSARTSTATSSSTPTATEIDFQDDERDQYHALRAATDGVEHRARAAGGPRSPCASATSTR